MSGIRNFLGVPSLLSASPLATLNLSVEVDTLENLLEKPYNTGRR
jgi:hypothetical protein